MTAGVQSAALGASMFTRVLTFGRTGNIRVRDGDRVLVTRTGASLGALAPDVLPPLTAYYVMRVGRVPLLPCHAPGDASLGPLDFDQVAALRDRERTPR
jgi:hypothetical protein